MTKRNFIKSVLLVAGLSTLSGVAMASCALEKISEISFKPGLVRLTQAGKIQVNLLKKLADELDGVVLKGFPDRLGRKRTVFIGYQLSEAGVKDLNYKVTRKKAKPGSVEVWVKKCDDQVRPEPKAPAVVSKHETKKAYVWKPGIVLSKTISEWTQKPVFVEQYDAKLQSGGAIFERSADQAAKTLADRAGCKLSFNGSQYYLNCAE